MCANTGALTALALKLYQSTRPAYTQPADPKPAFTPSLLRRRSAGEGEQAVCGDDAEQVGGGRAEGPVLALRQHHGDIHYTRSGRHIQGAIGTVV